MTDEDSQESREDISNDKWFEKNYAELIERYPMKWIAVLDNRVVDAAEHKISLQEDVAKKYPDKECTLFYVPGSM